MMIHRSLFVMTVAALALSIAACSQPSAPSTAATKPTSAPDHDPLGAIRAAGMGMDSSLQVQPLRDPAIDGYLKQAQAAETAKNFDAAAEAMTRALKLAPDAPDLLQYQAEIEVLRNHWKPAEELAMKSWSLGAKLGSLCARNWQTVVEARLAMNDAATVAQAKQHLKECRVAPPVRM